MVATFTGAAVRGWAGLVGLLWISCGKPEESVLGYEVLGFMCFAPSEKRYWREPACLAQSTINRIYQKVLEYGT